MRMRIELKTGSEGKRWFFEEKSQWMQEIMIGLVSWTPSSPSFSIWSSHLQRRVSGSGKTPERIFLRIRISSARWIWYWPLTAFPLYEKSSVPSSLCDFFLLGTLYYSFFPMGLLAYCYWPVVLALCSICSLAFFMISLILYLGRVLMASLTSWA